MNINLLSTLMWVFFAVVAAIAIQLPMLLKGTYTFLLPNTIIIILSILYVHFSLNFYKVSFHRFKWVRYSIFMGNILLFIYLLNRLEALLNYIDAMAIYKLLPDKFLSIEETANLLNYINKEYFIFTLALFVLMAFYNISIVRSFYKSAQLKSQTQL